MQKDEGEFDRKGATGVPHEPVFGHPWNGVVTSQLQERINAITAYAKSLETDAKRYRWLRDWRLCGNPNFSMSMGWKPESLTRDQVDASIDATMESPTGERRSQATAQIPP